MSKDEYENDNEHEHMSGVFTSRTATAEQARDEEWDGDDDATAVGEAEEPEPDVEPDVEPDAHAENEPTGAAGAWESVDDPEVTGYLPAIQEPPAAQTTARPSDTAPAGPGGAADVAATADTPDSAATAEATGSAATPDTPDFVGSAAAVDAAAEERLARMQAIQLAFIDDPRKAAADAQDLLGDVLRSLTEELDRQRDALRNPPPDGTADTERMRLAVRRSRQLIDTLAHV